MLVATLALAACELGGEPARIVGQLESDRVELTADVTEPIVEILVAEGELVAQGQVLVRQDAARATARLAEAEASVAQARARRDELVRGPREEQIAAARASVLGAERELAFREAEYARTSEVHALDLASPEQLDTARAARDAARANLGVTRATLEERLAGTTIEELAQAEAAVAQAAARRDLARVDVDRHEIRAPSDGVLDSRLFEIGERPNVGQPVIVMLGGEQPFARVYVGAAERASVAAGDSASVYVDGLDQVLDGRVRWVANEAAFTPYFALTERDRGRLSYEAKIDIEPTDRRLPDGVPVEVAFGDEATP